MWGRRYSGYRSQRSRGCVPLIVWGGICLNLTLILYSLGEGSSLSLSALLPTSDTSRAAAQAFNRGDLNAAVDNARSAYTADPQDTAALITLVRGLVYRSYVDFHHAEDLTDALDTAATAAARLPDNPDALAAHAFALQANGQAAAAVEQAERALVLDETHTLARTALALGYARVGSYNTALRESQLAAEGAGNTPTHFDARRAAAISTADLGRYVEAGKMLDTLIEDYNSMIPLYYERALYARQVSNPDAAESAYLRVLALDPENIKARLRLCEMAESIGERDSALQYCQQITDAAPTLPDGWYRLGRVHFLDGSFAQAQQALNRCSSLQVMQGTPPAERIFECWYLQGQAAEITGDCPALIAVYEQFQVMAADDAVRETWTYPPEGPPMCSQP